MHCLNPEQKARIAKIWRCSWMHQTQTKLIPEKPCHLALFLTYTHGAHSRPISSSSGEHRRREAAGNPNYELIGRNISYRTLTNLFQGRLRETRVTTKQTKSVLCCWRDIYSWRDVYIYIYIPTDGLCSTQQKNWCSLCSCMCSVSLCWSVWLALFTCVNISVCLCTPLQHKLRLLVAGPHLSCWI